jgi:hypothetical protein
MRKRTPVRLALACALTLALGSAAWAGENWIGTWKLNAAKSKYSPGPGPASGSVKFEKADGAIKVTVDAVDAQGKPIHYGYASKFDGKEVPWTGNPDGDTAAARRIDDNTYENVSRKGGKVSVTSKVSVSADGKTLNITQTGTDGQGRAVKNALVYERQ